MLAHSHRPFTVLGGGAGGPWAQDAFDRTCDTWRARAQTSQVYWHYVLVTLAPPAPCFLDVTVAAVDANASAAGNTKVKVLPRAAGLRPGGCYNDPSLWALLSFSASSTESSCATELDNAYGAGFRTTPGMVLVLSDTAPARTGDVPDGERGHGGRRQPVHAAGLDRRGGQQHCVSGGVARW